MDRPLFRGAAAVALALLLLNLLVLALGLSWEESRHQARTLVGYNADKVRIVRPSHAIDAPRPEANRTEPGAVNAMPAPEMDTQKDTLWHKEASNATAQSSPDRICVTLNLDGIDAYTVLRRAMSQVGLEQFDLRAEARLGWWVYWPPIRDPIQQVKVLVKIEQAGVKDIVPIRKGPMAQAISLGMFTNEADARRHQLNLLQRGLNAVQIGPRPGVRMLYLDIPAVYRPRLKALNAVLPTTISLKEVACAG